MCGSNISGKKKSLHSDKRFVIQDAFLAEFGIRNISQFTQKQRDQLLSFYLINKYPSTQERQTIAESIGISEYQVKVWFSNRRSREKK